MTQEIAQLRKAAHNERKKARDRGDALKGEFLREAASLRRQIDDAHAELEQLQADTAAKEPVRAELRARMTAHAPRVRQRELEAESQARLASVRDECARLRTILDE